MSMTLEAQELMLRLRNLAERVTFDVVRRALTEAADYIEKSEAPK